MRSKKKKGVSASLRLFKSTQELDLKESTVCGWVTTYQKRLHSLRKEGKPLMVSVLSEKSRGRPLPIGSGWANRLLARMGYVKRKAQRRPKYPQHSLSD